MNPKGLLKVGVVLSSALLMAAFVAYRAGAFSRFTPAGTPPPATDTAPLAAPAVKASPDGSPAAKLAAPSARRNPVLIPSSKSIILTDASQATTPASAPPPAAPPKPPTIMVGPKSAPVFVPPTTPWIGPEQVQPVAQQPATPARRLESGGPRR